MAKRATATNWEVVVKDDEGAMVNIDFNCPYCGYSTGVLISVGSVNTAGQVEHLGRSS